MKYLVGLLAGVVGLIAGVQAQPASPRAEDLVALIQAELEVARVPGASIAVVAGEAMHAAGFGIANAETRALMAATTLVHTGSLTKLFTALALSAALDARKIPFDSPVGKHVRGLSPRAAAATFHQLLSGRRVTCGPAARMSRARCLR